MESKQFNDIQFVGSSLKDLRNLPEEVRSEFGHELYVVQTGETPANAKPLKGFGGAGVVELIENHNGDTFRAVYTVRFAGVVYVLHVFQKKSKSGIATPQKDLDLIKARLKAAEALYAAHKPQKEES